MKKKDSTIIKCVIILAIFYVLAVVGCVIIYSKMIDLKSQLFEANAKIVQLEYDLDKKEIELQREWQRYPDFTCVMCGFKDDVETILFKKSYHIKCHRCNYVYDITAESTIDYGYEDK